MSQLIQSKISAVRSKNNAVSAARGFAAIAGAAVVLLAATMLLDWLLELPRPVRAGLLALDIGVLGYILGVRVLAPIFWGPDDEDIALLVEHAMPEFNTRLIAAVQFVKPRAISAGSSAGLVRAMIRQTESLAGPKDFTSVVKADPMLRTMAMSAFILLAGVGSFTWSRDVSFDLLRRAFLANVDVPRNTRVKSVTEDKVIPIGDPITLEAAARGVLPASGKVELRFESGRKQAFTIDKAADSSEFYSRTIDNVQESFSYRIRINDGLTSWFKVQAVPRPTVVAVEFQQKYPQYTKRGVERRSPGDLSLLVGSELQVKVTASKAIKDGKIRLVGLEREEAMTVESAEAAGAFQVPARGLTGIAFRLIDEHGIESRGETVYPIDLILDKEPFIKVTHPDRKEELATQQARILVGFEATDDIGIEKVSLRWKYDTQENGSANTIDLDLGDQPERRQIRRRYEFDLSKIRPLPPEGGAVEWWIEVLDGNTVTGPGKFASDHYRVRIVSELEKRTDLLNRLNDQLGTIDYVTQDQEKLNQKLGALIIEKK